MSLPRTVVVLVSLLLACLTFTVVPAHADPTGQVIGQVKAKNYGWVALCSAHCKHGNTTVGSGMDAPEFYELDLNYKSGRFSSKEDVEAGEYRLYVEAWPYSSGPGALGYVVATDDGFYRATDDFEDASVFTIAEASDLDLGVLDMRADGPPAQAWVNGPVRAEGYGGQFQKLLVPFKATQVPEGTRLVVKTYGCGKRQAVRRYTRSGKFTFTFVDKAAHRHYSKSVRSVVVAKFPDGKKRVLDKRRLSVKSFGWSC